MEQMIASAIGTTKFLVPLAFLTLVIFSIVSVGIMFERAMTLKRVRRVEDSDFGVLRDMILKNQDQALRATVAASQAPSATALQAGLELRDSHPDLVHEAITQEIEIQCAELGRNLPILGTIASTAPYVGLFGTVLGILNAFAEIARTNQTGASAVAKPISEALFATGVGLGVAIPAVMAFNYFSGRVNDLSLHVENHALKLAARLPAMKAGVEENEA